MATMIRRAAVLASIALVIACRASSPDAPPKSVAPDATATPTPSSSTAAPARAAVSHRATAGACPAVVPPPGYVNTPAAKLGGAYSCNKDSDCGGTNARCHRGPRMGTYCTSDACVSDTDCGPGKVCECGTGNQCLPANCHVDADCGGRSCSPTAAETCGNMSGTVGYYCHTAKDDCVDDAECTTAAAAGRCTYKPTAAHWTCSYEMCVG